MRSRSHVSSRQILQLRAAMSLARLWRDQGKVHEGHWLNNHVPIPDKLGAFIGALLPRGLGMAMHLDL